MTSTEIAAVGTDLAMRVEKAKLLATSDLLPPAYQKNPGNLIAAMEVADTLGITLMQAVQGVVMVKGRLTMSAELMRSLVNRAGHQLRISEMTAEACRMDARRREWPDDVQSFEFTIEDARAAGLAQSDTYKKYPKAMLLARCTSMACRAVFPDVIAGISYTPDELEPLPPWTAEPVTITGALAPAATAPPADGGTISDEQVSRITELFAELETVDGSPMAREERRAWVAAMLGLPRELPVSALTAHQADEVITALQRTILGPAHDPDTGEVVEP